MGQRNFVKIYSNACSSDLCERLIEWHNTDKEARTESPDRITRQDVQKWLPLESELGMELQKCKLRLRDHYLKSFPSAYRGQKKLEAPESKIQRTDPFGGGFHNFHSEITHWENCSRALVWTIYLNSVREGEGETEFLYEPIRLLPRQGMGVVWPAAWMYQHRGNPVHSKSKYIATGWFWYPKEEFYYK